MATGESEDGGTNTETGASGTGSAIEEAPDNQVIEATSDPGFQNGSSQYTEAELDEIAFRASEWEKRIDAAFVPVACGSSPQADFPASYYAGPLIDTHLHIPQLPDDGFGDDGDEDHGDISETRGKDGELGHRKSIDRSCPQDHRSISRPFYSIHAVFRE